MKVGMVGFHTFLKFFHFSKDDSKNFKLFNVLSYEKITLVPLHM